MVLLGGCGSKSEYTIDKVDIVADVLPDGDLYVEELYTYTVRGEYEKISRFMDNFGDSNIEFFEAYVPPKDRELGNFGYKDLERYPVSVSAKSGSYYVDLQAKDETREVYYRYRLDREALKYADGGELDWTVLESNDADHRNVTVTVRTRQQAHEPLIGYAYDRSGGSVTEETTRLVRYENKLLPEYDTLRLKVFFPAAVLPDMEVSEHSASRTERLADEAALLQRFMDRERLLEVGRYASRWLTYAAVAGIVFYALSLRKLAAWWRGRRISDEEVEDLDPVRFLYIYRKGKLKLEDILAGVFALRRMGAVVISMVQSGTRFQEDPEAPKQLPQFAFRGNRAQLKPAERYLVSWLFRGGTGLNLEHVSGPTKTERKHKGSMSPYATRMKRLRKGLGLWRELIEAEDGRTPKYGEYSPRKVIVPGLALAHLALLIYLYIADATPWGWVALLAVALGGGAVWASMRRHHKGYISAYLVACIFVAAQIMHDPVVDEYLNFVFLSFLLVALLPGRVTDRNSEAYRSAIMRYSRRLAKGRVDEGGDPERLERMVEAALLTGIGRRFLARTNDRPGGFMSALTSPLFDPAAHAAIDYAFIRSWKGLAGETSTGGSGGGYGDSGDSSYGGGGDSGGDGGGDGGGGGD